MEIGTVIKRIRKLKQQVSMHLTVRIHITVHVFIVKVISGSYNKIRLISALRFWQTEINIETNLFYINFTLNRNNYNI